jgi:hypothetical protein
MIGLSANTRRIMKTVTLAGALIAGVAGAAAAADGRGPARGFFVSGPPTGAAEPIGDDFTEIQVFESLPRGSYIANAGAVLVSSSPEPRLVDCVFTLDGVIQGELPARGVVGAIVGFLTLPLTIGFTIETVQDLGVACRADVPDLVQSQPSTMTAIRVNRLIVQRHF